MNRTLAKTAAPAQTPAQKKSQAFTASLKLPKAILSRDRAIGQSGNRAIGQSGNRAIGQSGNRAIGQLYTRVNYRVNHLTVYISNKQITFSKKEFSA